MSKLSDLRDDRNKIIKCMTRGVAITTEKMEALCGIEGFLIARKIKHLVDMGIVESSPIKRKASGPWCAFTLKYTHAKAIKMHEDAMDARRLELNARRAKMERDAYSKKRADKKEVEQPPKEEKDCKKATEIEMSAGGTIKEYGNRRIVLMSDSHRKLANDGCGSGSQRSNIGCAGYMATMGI